MEKIPTSPLPSKEKAERLTKLRELIQGTPDAFFTLAGAMKYNEQKGRYESGGFSVPDQNSALATGILLATGSKDRVLAAATLHEAFPDATIVTLSRTRDETKPTYAEVARTELINKGINPDQIMVEDESVNTITELKTVARLCRDHAWSNVVIVSSNWHLPRVEALLNHLENFADSPEETALLSSFAETIRRQELTIQFIGTTEVLSTKGRAYERFFDTVSRDPGLQKRIEVEKMAVELIATGHYGNIAIPKKIWDDKI